MAIRRGLSERMPLFPNRLEENPPREVSVKMPAYFWAGPLAEGELALLFASAAFNLIRLPKLLVNAAT
jgi:hypothetical protein